MQEYPKALYFGTVQAHQHKVVNGFEHESELRELGFVDFADLEKDTVKTVGSASSQDLKNALVPIEQFDDVVADLADKEHELTIVRGERDQLKAENDDLKGQLHQTHEANKQLQQALDSLQPDPAPQDTAVDTVAQGTPTEPAAPDYSKKTAKELRALLDEKGIKYLQRDDVDTLRALLTQPEKTEE